jgi:sensor histidine kinase YesM
MGADYLPVSQQGEPEAPASPSPVAPSQTDANQALENLQGTLNEMQMQIKRSSMWVYYMIVIQIVCFIFTCILLLFSLFWSYSTLILCNILYLLNVVNYNSPMSF